MLAAGIVIVWAGYAVGSWGYVLVRGWNITFRQWVSPLNPYQWPQGGPAVIPDSQLLPGRGGGGSGQGGGGSSSGGGGGGQVPQGVPGKPYTGQIPSGPK